MMSVALPAPPPFVHTAANFGREGVGALGHRILFYPKFHCELNFIERYWCQAKWFTRGNDFEALKAIVPEALASVTNASIRLLPVGSAHY